MTERPQATQAHFLRCAIVAALSAYDPEAALPLLQCQVRDLMCYAHSSGLYLQETGHLKQARDAWQAWLAQRPEALQAQLRTGVARMGWMRRLPQDRSLGRDLLRARVAYDLMH